MGFSVIPTNVGGVSLNSLAGPLAKLITGSNKTDTSRLTWPSDLGSNPSMGHAVIIQAFDRSTKLQQSAKNALVSLDGALQFAHDLISAPSYQASQKEGPLATVSLFMPETVNVTYNSSYSEISMTQELGALGYVGNAISDVQQKGWVQGIVPYAEAAAAKKAGDIARSALGMGENITAIAQQQMNQVTNPQTQLLYRGIDLRTFQLEFLMTPKSPAEAKTIKDICDTLVYYSLPGLAGGQTTGSGQFLTPPQIFSIQFKFLGQSGIVGSLSNIFSSALTNSGLGFLVSGDTNISNGNPAKTFNVGDCVLENVSVDYAPNGWATYNDGYPVQTRLTLQFKETQMYTKQSMSDVAASSNYNSFLDSQRNVPIEQTLDKNESILESNP